MFTVIPCAILVYLRRFFFKDEFVYPGGVVLIILIIRCLAHKYVKLDLKYN